MSLQVWLPLTDGTLKQQGLSNVTVSSSGTVSLTNAGKLGKCVTFTSTAGGLTIPASAMTSFTSACSVSFWLKINGWGSSYDTYFQAGTGSTSWAAYIFGFLRNGTNSTICFTIGNGSSASNNSYLTSALSTNTWYHIALTYETGKVKIYLNGVLDHEYTTSIVPAFSSITKISVGRSNADSSYQTQCDMNDLRIYNHCLSQMEVKELAKGLVLHYPLNRNGWGQENLLLNTNSSVTWNGTVASNGYTVKDFYKTQIPVPSLFTVDELVTVSFDWSTTATTGNFHVECGAVTPWVWGTVISSSGKGNRSSTSNYVDLSSSVTSGHLIVTFKITSNQTGATETLQWLRIRKDGTEGETFSFTMSNAKVERGSIATPWCPNSSDTLATTMSLNSTTEYDCSGFCNNGTRTGTFTWSSDTPKYNVSTEFNSSRPNYIQVPNSSYALQGAEAMTWSVWAYDDDWTNYSGRIYSCTEGGGVSIESGNSGASLNWAVNMYTAADKSTYAYQGYCTISVSSLTPGWHLFTWTYTTGGTKIYVDGVLKNQVNITSYGLHFNTVALLHLGAEASGSTTPTAGYYFTGKLSDFRIYATALSAEDIKSLYQNAAYIDSSGNIYGAIHMEA